MKSISLSKVSFSYPSADELLSDIAVSFNDIESDSKSGGECQQKKLANAFASKADFLLLDEPTNNLDSAARSDFFEKLRNFSGGALILISHDDAFIKSLEIHRTVWL